MAAGGPVIGAFQPEPVLPGRCPPAQEVKQKEMPVAAVPAETRALPRGARFVSWLIVVNGKPFGALHPEQNRLMGIGAVR
jgi:hypothetical protein